MLDLLYYLSSRMLPVYSWQFSVSMKSISSALSHYHNGQGHATLE